MIPIVVIRPQPGCDATVAAARQIGLQAHGHPLFEVECLPWDAPDARDFDALLIGSANALAHAGPALAGYAGMPAYVVGEKTAEAASAAGLRVAAIGGGGGLQGVLDEVRPPHRRLLRLAGRERIALSPPPGVTLEERLVYASVPRPMPEALAELLALPAIVLLHSGEAARHFAAQCDARGVARDALCLVAIGPRVAEAAGRGWAETAIAETPRDSAMLALARLMCQRADGSP